MTKIAFICQRGLETFIEPIVKRFETGQIDQTVRGDGVTSGGMLAGVAGEAADYQVRRYYVQTNQEVIAAVKWADVVFLEWANESSILATSIYDLRKKGVIVRLHSYEAFTDMPGRIDWSVVDYLVFVAPHIREIVRRHIPDIEDRVCTTVIPNGVDIDRIALNETLNLYDIAFVANCADHKKNPPLLLQIMAALVAKDPAYRLHVAGSLGDERYKTYLEHMAREMGIADNILYYGFVKDMDAFWQGKGVILSTSIHEGHPLNVIEGAARGLRPVIHNFYGASDLYPKGWLYNTVAEAVDLIIGGKTLNTGPGFRQHVLDRGWTLDNMVAQIKTLINRVSEPAESHNTEETADATH